MSELVETEGDYVKKLGHVCEVGVQALPSPVASFVVDRTTLESWKCWRDFLVAL